jgi:hypothetical protein
MKVRLIALILIFLASCYAAQDRYGDSFTISVVKPLLAKDVQMSFAFVAEPTINGVKTRYFYPGVIPSPGWGISDPAGNKTVVRTGVKLEPPKKFKLIAFAPGCQLVTISVDDLDSSNREGQIKCTTLNTIEFRGKVNVSPSVEKPLQVEVLYGCNWAEAFFSTRSIAPITFSLGKTDIASDGSFTISLPDFAADPLWPTIANNATLFFSVVDGANGQRLGEMVPPADLSPKGGPLKVAPSYPVVDFSVKSN